MSDLEIIKKNKEFRKIYSKGKSTADRYVVIYSLENKLNICRVGFTVSKKIGNAVKRNRIRRIFREVCRLNLKKIPGGYDYILLARRDITGLNYWQIEKSILKLLKKINFNKG